jgi:hypothetical protein
VSARVESRQTLIVLSNQTLHSRALRWLAVAKVNVRDILAVPVRSFTARHAAHGSSEKINVLGCARAGSGAWRLLDMW